MQMKQCDDSELYTWKKVDITDDSQKKLVDDYWAEEGEFGGKTYNGSKSFK